MLIGLYNIMATLAADLIGPFGILLVTVNLAGTCIGVLFFHVPQHYIWKAIWISVILLTAGGIAAALRA